MPDDEDASDDHRTSDSPDEPQHGPSAHDDGFGDDFDDFEAGAEAEDFGDFDDGFEQPAADPEPPRPEPPPVLRTAHVSNIKYTTASHGTHLRILHILQFRMSRQIVR